MTSGLLFELIDELERDIDACEAELRRIGTDHPYVPLLKTVPGIGDILAYTIAAELGDLTRFASPKKLCGYTGLCPRVDQSGDKDYRGPLSKKGPKYLRWALIEAAVHASRHPRYHDRYQATKKRLGKQRGAKVARVELARTLSEAIWHMLNAQRSSWLLGARREDAERATRATPASAGVERGRPRHRARQRTMSWA